MSDDEERVRGLMDQGFELAHDFPVHGASDDDTVRWAHRSCNRGDGA